MDIIYLQIDGINGELREIEAKLPEGKIIVDKAEYESLKSRKEKKDLIRLRKQLNKIISKYNI